MSQSRLKALQTLRKLRVAERDQARDAFAKALLSEQEIESTIKDIETDIARNEDHLRQKQSEHGDQLIMEMSYYHWLGAMRAFIEQKKNELKEAKEFTEQARRQMIEANTALEATDKMIERIKKALSYQEECKAQTEIDDMARVCFMRQNHRTV